MTKIDNTKEYAWNSEFRNPIAHTDIKPVIEELETILELRGEITPAFVVESAKNKKSPLHNYFEWDNEKAAHSWRIRQASKLLGHIEVKVIKNGEPSFIRAYSVTKYNSDSGGGQFKRTIDFDSVDIDFLKRMVSADLKRVSSKLKNYPELSKANKFVNEAIEELSKISTETKEEAKPTLTAVV